MKIGFIGLGNMGAPMATNLSASGHTVRGYDLVAQPPAGVEAAVSPADAAASAEVVITMLPNGAILQDVAEKVLPEMPRGAIFLDCSTVDIESAQAVARKASALGLHFLDAPVSGGIGGAAAGTLTFMVGGDAEAFASAQPLFEVMGQKAVLCGDAGTGQAAKICNNMILGVTMIATCEAFGLADRLGLSRQSLFDVVSTSSGFSWSMNTYCPAPGIGPQSPSDNEYRAGFATALMLKDMRLSQQAAGFAGAETPLGALATQIYSDFADENGTAELDFSSILSRFEGPKAS